MAKIIKDTRETIDVDTELEKIRVSNDVKKTTEKKKKDDKKKDDKKKTTKKNKKVKKHSKIYTFFKEVKSEMAKVKWSSKKDMVKYSIATIVFVIFFALFFYAIDLIIALLKAGV